ncbi:hypothetical protein D3C75_945020 [compost metagenome]
MFISSCVTSTPEAAVFAARAAICRLIINPNTVTPIVCPIDFTKVFKAFDAPRSSYPTDDWAITVNTAKENPKPMPYSALNINSIKIDVSSDIKAIPPAPRTMMIIPMSEV